MRWFPCGFIAPWSMVLNWYAFFLSCSNLDPAFFATCHHRDFLAFSLCPALGAKHVHQGRSCGGKRKNWSSCNARKLSSMCTAAGYGRGQCPLAVHLGGRSCWCPADIDTIGVLQFDAASRLRIFVNLVCAWWLWTQLHVLAPTTCHYWSITQCGWHAIQFRDFAFASLIVVTFCHLSIFSQQHIVLSWENR